MLNEAIETNIIQQYVWTLGNLPNAAICQNRELIRISTGLPSLAFNLVLGAKFNSSNSHIQIDKVIKYFDSLQLPMTWHIGSLSRPSNLNQLLLTHGLTYLKKEVGMSFDLTRLPVDCAVYPELTIKVVDNANSLRDWLVPIIACFKYNDIADDILKLYSNIILNGHTKHYMYVGFINEKPVAASRLFIENGVAGIYHVAVMPEVRKKGIGSAMTLKALHDVRELGCSLAILRASEMGLNVYKNLGFKEQCEIEFYLFTPIPHCL